VIETQKRKPPSVPNNHAHTGGVNARAIADGSNMAGRIPVGLVLEKWQIMENISKMANL
jgi:hypothetical protein